MSRRKKKHPVQQQAEPAERMPNAPQPPSAIPEGGAQKMSLFRGAQVLFALACGISLYLGYTSLTSAQLAGCGTGSDCDTVLTSRWAYWFGLPVSVPASGFYLLMLTASVFAGPNRSVAGQKRAWNLLVAGAFVVLAAALWFIGLQAMIVKSWCKFCMAAHLLGSAGSICVLAAAPFVIRHPGEKPFLFGVAQRAWPALMGMLALVPLVVGQYFSAPPSASIVVAETPTTQVEAPSPPASEPSTNQTPESAESPQTATAPEPQRWFTVHDRYQLNLYDVPLIGNPEAPHVMVSLFDYTCSHCRNMHGRLKRVQNQYSNELAIVVMPMPLDSTCNPLLSRTAPDHVNACRYAKIALALFKVKEERFEEFEDWLFETERPRPLDEVFAKAKEWTGVDDFEAVVNDVGVKAWIDLGISVFQENFRVSQQRVLPMIMAGSAISAGELKSDEELISFLTRNLGLDRKPTTSVLP